MSKTMDLLHDEHVGVALLMKILDQQMEAFAEGESPDYELMYEVMDYMVNYPDRYHHPKEDLVFARLEKRDPSLGPAIQDLKDEHRLLHDKGKALLENLDSVVNDFMVSRDTIETMTREYEQLLMRHMTREETKVFPSARRELLAEDWTELDDITESQHDPVFGEVVESEYIALRLALAEIKSPPEA